MPTKVVNLDRKGINTIIKGLKKPIDNARTFFQILGLKIDSVTQLTFRAEGARAGHRAWTPFSRDTLFTRAGTWKIRYGTDLRGRPKGSYIPGKLRKGVRRYSSSSKLLLASGGFRRSFGIIRITNDYVMYGIKGLQMRKLKIGSKPERQVLFVTEQDKIRWGGDFKNYYRKGLKF